MPRLSQADAELVVRCLERALEEGTVDPRTQDPRSVSQVLARLKTRLEQCRANPDSRPRRSRRPSGATSDTSGAMGSRIPWSAPAKAQPRLDFFAPSEASRVEARREQCATNSPTVSKA